MLSSLHFHQQQIPLANFASFVFLAKTWLLVQVQRCISTEIKALNILAISSSHCCERRSEAGVSLYLCSCIQWVHFFDGTCVIRAYNTQYWVWEAPSVWGTCHPTLRSYFPVNFHLVIHKNLYIGNVKPF